MGNGRIVALLLAAGRGSRFDPSGEHDKLLTLLDGIPVAMRAAASLRDCDHRVAVIAPEKPQLGQTLAQAGCELVIAADAGLGMGHSIAAGARYIARMPDVAAVLIMLGDMPQLQTRTVRALIDCFRSETASAHSQPLRIIAPCHQGRRGHPVIFGAAHLPALSCLQGDQGAARLMRGMAIQSVDVDDAGTLNDIDTRDDLSVAGGALDRRHHTPSRHQP